MKDAHAAWEALEKARAIGAKTQRERDWIEALSAYYRDRCPARIRSLAEETPNRYRGFWGAARAAEAAGNRQKAADYYAKLIALSKNADTTRPELARARGFVAQR